MVSTSRIKYVPDRINPQQAYDLYKQGSCGDGMLGAKYKVRVALMEDKLFRKQEVLKYKE